MSDEPRYSEEEVREIFELATTPADSGHGTLTRADGLSLAEIQEIGREVGLRPEQIAQAASAIEVRRGALPRRTSFGLPVSVGHVVALDRAPTDDEWDLLVAELQATFQSRGTVRSSGHVRHWKTGNLHAIIEPTDTGWRLRIGTTKGGAVGSNLLGIGGLLLAAVFLAVVLTTGGLDEEIVSPAVIALLSAGAFARNALTLPAWADEREEQMLHIAGRARALTSASE